MALSKERDAVYAEQKRLVSEHRELTLRLTALEHEAEENAATISAIEAELEGMRSQIESDSAVTAAEKEAQKRLEEERATLSAGRVRPPDPLLKYDRVRKLAKR